MRSPRMPQRRALNGAVEWLEEVLSTAHVENENLVTFTLDTNDYNSLKEDLSVYKAARSKKL